MSETATENETPDLSWLADVTPIETTMRTSRRGRQPGKNPVAGHVKRAHDAGKVIALQVPAKHGRKTERMLRRAALREAWSISVQVLSKNPEAEKPEDRAGADDVIALKDLDKLPDQTADIWISFEVTDKAEDETATVPETGTDENTDAPADPFAGSPDAADEPAATSDEPTDTPKPAKSGRRSGRGAAA